MHIGTDESGIVIRGVEVTPANVHDSRKLKSLVSGEEEAVYADKAYDSERVRNWREKNGIECCILHKGVRDRPLTDVNWKKTRDGLRNALA